MSRDLGCMIIELQEKRGVLHHAALGGHVEGLECLLDRGLNINDRTNKGLTPVHLAVHAGSLPCLQLLAKRGADVKCTDRVSVAAGWLPCLAMSGAPCWRNE